ncbi:oxidoreductase [Spirosoma areae]
MVPKIWLITGISSGLGKALADEVIANGDFVIGTFRNDRQVDTFNESHQGKGYAILLDITKASEIKTTFETVNERFGKLDVLVNNAGVGFAGAIEETSIDEARAVFDVNFFSALEITKAFLPLFRQQKKGHIVQISSHGGLKAFPGFGIYNASKFALEGFSEALAAEVAPLGIHVTLVEPGPFRTNFAGHSFREASLQLTDYESTAGAFRERMRQVNGQQEGDPKKAAKAIIDLVGSAYPPLRMPLGKIALATITSKIESVQRDVKTCREVAEQAVFD